MLKINVFLNVTPCKLEERYHQHFGGILVHFCWITWHHIPENSNPLEGREVPTMMVIFWGRTALFATCFTLVSCLFYSLVLKMEVTCSFETSVDFQRITQRYNPTR
jgi:uncharacterized membrane protein